MATSKRSKSGKTDDNDRPEPREDERDVFERRRQWFQEVFGESGGCLATEGRVRGIEQAARLRAKPSALLDPGTAPSEQGFGLDVPDGLKATARPSKNVRPQSSFGFVGSAVQVQAQGRIPGTRLTLSLGDTDHVLTESIRVFRAESDGEWALVARSGVNTELGYAWAHITTPGIYVAVGVPSDPWLLTTVMTLESHRPWLNAARTLDRLPEALDRICHFILCAGPFADVVDDPAALEKLGLPPIGGRGGGNICDRCLGLDPPRSGLPEVHIIRDFENIKLLPPRIFWPPWWWCSSWTSIGPVNISGRIKSLAIHPRDGNVVYAGAADGGVWKTVNGGASWWATMTLQLSMAIGAVAVSPSSPDIVYAATGEDTPGWGPSYTGVGIYRSVDAGGDWDLRGAPASSLATRLLIHPTDPNTVYVAGNAGLHRSIDGGLSWTTVRSGHASDALLDPRAPDTLYVGAWGAGVFKSTDAGVTWNQLTNGIPTGAAAIRGEAPP